MPYGVFVRFEWDPDKAASNLRKHGVSFEDALRAALEPERLEWMDDRFDYGEARTRLLGQVDGRLLFVVIAEDDAVVRIISARKATTREQEKYYRRR